jgi:hypothetical protein
MNETSLLQHTGVFSTFHIENPTTFLSFSQSKDQRKKVYIVASKATIDIVQQKKKKKKERKERNKKKRKEKKIKKKK